MNAGVHFRLGDVAIPVEIEQAEGELGLLVVLQQHRKVRLEHALAGDVRGGRHGQPAELSGAGGMFVQLRLRHRPELQSPPMVHASIETFRSFRNVFWDSIVDN